MYWIISLHSDENYYDAIDIKYLEFYNPRLNIAYRLNVNNIDKDVITEVEKNIYIIKGENILLKEMI